LSPPHTANLCASAGVGTVGLLYLVKNKARTLTDIAAIQFVNLCAPSTSSSFGSTVVVAGAVVAVAFVDSGVAFVDAGVAFVDSGVAVGGSGVRAGVDCGVGTYSPGVGCKYVVSGAGVGGSGVGDGVECGVGNCGAGVGSEFAGSRGGCEVLGGAGVDGSSRDGTQEVKKCLSTYNSEFSALAQ